MNPCEQRLLPQHQQHLEASGIDREVLRQRGYRSVETKAELRRYGFNLSQARTPALLIPLWNVSGKIGGYQIRPDEPRCVGGRITKYEMPSGFRMVLDVPKSVREKLLNPSVPLFVTEGVKKADSAVSRGLCCIALLGVWNWRGTNSQGGKTVLADWESIALNESTVYIVFDSDVSQKPGVHAAMARLKAFLKSRGARVFIVYLPSAKDGGKVGLDDFLVSGKTVDDLLALARSELRKLDKEEEDPLLYKETSSGIVWKRQSREGVIETQITNFTARIAEDVIEDDGLGTRRVFTIRAKLLRREYDFDVPADRFAVMNWPVRHMGAKASIFAGFGYKDRARDAIQHLSEEVKERRVYTHTGWRKTEGEYVYLHSDGGIGAAGTIPELSVRLPRNLAPFRLPDPPEGETLREVVGACFKLLHLAPLRITVPLFGAAWRAPLIEAEKVDYTIHLTGQSGSLKTEIATLAQGHFGAGFNRKNITDSWKSTDNALEKGLFRAKDGVYLIDDFVLTGSTADIARMHRKADNTLRGVGNMTGRGRLRADGSERTAFPPRSVPLSTGEDIPAGESLGARLVIVDLQKGDIDQDKLTIAQGERSAGTYAAAMAGYIRHLAAQMDSLKRTLTVRQIELRKLASSESLHLRTPDNIASLMVGWEQFIEFAQEVGAISTQEAAAIQEMVWKGLLEAEREQSTHQLEADPVLRFLSLLSAALSSGRAHVADVEGGPPDPPESWGWHEYNKNWLSDGRCIGWVEGDNLYLEPNAAHAEVVQLAKNQGESYGTRPHTLRQRLSQKGMLVSSERARETFTVRKVIGGKRRPVLHIKASLLFGAGLPAHAEKPAQKNRLESRENTGPGRDGQDGQAIRTTYREESASERCFSCGGTDFWRHREGSRPICSDCHPPSQKRREQSL